MADQFPEEFGKYKITGEVGRGGFADVYKALDTTLDRTVALKFLEQRLLREPTFFGWEAGAAYMAMEFLEGRTLKEVILQEGALHPRRIVNIVEQVASALDYAHERDLVHRDIKPSNIMVGADDHVTVMDFGIAKAATHTALTTTGRIFGTPEYMSPEQAEGEEEPDARSDVYSLGVVVYEMLTGKVPFGGTTPLSVMRGHADKPPPPPSQFNPDISPAVEAVLLRTLAKKREERYQSAGEMAVALQQAVSRAVIEEAKAPFPVEAPPPEPAVAAKEETEQPTARPIPKTVPKKGLTLGVGALLAGGLVLLCVVGIIIFAISGGLSKLTPEVVEETKVVVQPTTPAPTVAPTAMPIPPTDTPVPPTSMPVPPTDTPLPPTPTLSPTPGVGRIAFASYRDGNWEIYVMNADGSGQTNLTNSPAWYEDEPSWSPDRSRIAFFSDRDGNGEIYVMNSDGSGQMNLTNHPRDEYEPSWSPDGTRITFISNRDGSGMDIYVMNADGSEVTRLTDNPSFDWWPSWSPDGSRIAFVSNRDGNQEIYVMNADGNGQTNLTNTSGWEEYPSWSPDGSRIVFASSRDGNQEIYVMNADGSGQMNLTNHPAHEWSPSWSSDSSRIAFVSNRDGNDEIYVMNVDGGG